MNAFMLWAKEKRVEMMGQGIPVGQVSQVRRARNMGDIQAMWNFLGMANQVPKGLHLDTVVSRFPYWAPFLTKILPYLLSTPLRQALSEQWKSLGEEERALYYREQDHLKELHKLQHPDYKFSPRSGRPPRSPAPVSPNQPPEAPEERLPNQPPQHGSVSPAIQVKFCSYLKTRPASSVVDTPKHSNNKKIKITCHHSLELPTGSAACCNTSGRHI